ncbi:MAG: ATP-dependent sacrificial sulfur transferase LarE [Oscillospiraceae bacterium]|nr:ATP-dependent sacrificial sulfur transferase LarE [Oscillospiraceae bacterium]
MDTQTLSALRAELLRHGRVAVAFSAGVDSTLLLKVAHDALGERAFALTARSCLFPEEETAAAEDFCRREGIEQIIVPHDPFGIDGFVENPPDRCYRCKRALFARFAELAAQRGAVLVEGSNLDDEGDYRPGLRAVAELGVASQLRAAGLRKADVRALARALGLTVWDKPSFACLASRFTHGETLTAQRLAAVAEAERRLAALGFAQYRVRVHGDLARIEVLPRELPRLVAHAAALHDALRALGFRFVTLDLGGYRSGSMNPVRDDNARRT